MNITKLENKQEPSTDFTVPYVKVQSRSSRLSSRHIYELLVSKWNHKAYSQQLKKTKNKWLEL
jgi:hypothetical protein